MLVAHEDRLPCVRWDDFEVRRYRDLLYAGPALPEPPTDTPDRSWNAREALPLGGGLGLLRTEIVRGAGLALARLPATLTVGFRRGGEELRLAGHAQHRDLKKLLQEADILPWWRGRIPLIRDGRALIAVADRWIAAEFAARGEEEGMRIVWDEAPRIEAEDASAAQDG